MDTAKGKGRIAAPPGRAAGLLADHEQSEASAT